MKKNTLVFLIKENQGKITDICLAMKKRGFGVGKWNGTGGKVEESKEETFEEGAIREAFEELGVIIEKENLEYVAEVTFHGTVGSFDVHVQVYLVRSWSNEPSESEEMNPQWFKVEDIPYNQMWDDDPHWLPLVLEGKKLKGYFEFENDKVTSKDITEVESLS